MAGVWILPVIAAVITAFSFVSALLPLFFCFYVLNARNNHFAVRANNVPHIHIFLKRRNKKGKEF